MLFIVADNKEPTHCENEESLDQKSPHAENSCP
ncbi:conserved hypothetical protein, partial [delta proteobacterium NaphS2]